MIVGNRQSLNGPSNLIPCNANIIDSYPSIYNEEVITSSDEIIEGNNLLMPKKIKEQYLYLSNIQLVRNSHFSLQCRYVSQMDVKWILNSRSQRSKLSHNLRNNPTSYYITVSHSQVARESSSHAFSIK